MSSSYMARLEKGPKALPSLGTASDGEKGLLFYLYLYKIKKERGEGF